jgi:L,D-transpeptidase ErfK/SrfK
MLQRNARIARRAQGLALLLSAAALAWPAHANQYVLPAGEDVVGEVRRVLARREDTLSDLARRYGAGYEEIVLANPKVDPWLPGDATTVVIPNRFVLPRAPRDGLVLNVAELRLYHFLRARPGEARQVVTYPVSVGRVDWRTPLGTTRVVRKVTDPAWNPPESIKREHAREGDILPDQVPPGPDNPLGQHALFLGVSGYLLHGTNKPFGIGMRVTHGCVRLYPEDIETLYHQVPIGTPVHLVDQPYKAGWSDGALYFEAHPPFGDEPEGEVGHLTEMVQVVMDALRDDPDYPVDWKRAEAEVLNPSGMPVAIGPRRGERSAGAPPATNGTTTPRAQTAPTPPRPVNAVPTASARTVPKTEAPPKRGSESTRPAR